MRILGFTPLHPDYGARPQTWQSITSAVAAYDGPIEWMFSSGDNPYSTSHENIAYQHNKARRIVLEQGYDALLSVEADMIIPADAISKLVEAEADIAYSLYVWRHNLKRWSTYYDMGVFGGHSISLDFDRAREAWGNIVDVAGLGMGCTLINRNVLETLEFRLFDGRADWLADEVSAAGQKMGLDLNPHRRMIEMVHDDWLLALEAKHHGFVQRAHMGVVCGHIETEGTILWPSLSAPNLFYAEAAA